MLRQLLVTMLGPIVGLWQEAKRAEKCRWIAEQEAKNKAREWERLAVAQAVRREIEPLLTAMTKAADHKRA